MTGVIVTSSSCSGTCLIFSIPRQPKVSAAVTARSARGGRAPEASAACKRLVGAGVERRRSCRSAHAASLLRGRLVLGLVLGRVAGERQEDLVEARLAEREVGDRDAGARQLGDRLGRPLGVGARAPTAPPGRPRGATGAELRRRAAARASARCSGSSSRTCSAPEPTDALSWAGVPSAITLPRSITAMPSASWSASSRYWVQSRIGRARRRPARG